MNIDDRLSLLSNLLSLKQTLYIWKYSSDLQLLSTNCPRKNLFSNVFHLSNCSKDVLNNHQQSNRPLVLTDPFDMVWINTYEEKAGKLQALHLIGPVFTTEITHNILEEKLRQYQISISYKRVLMTCMDEIPIIPATTFFEYGLMLHYCVTNERLDFSDLTYQKEKNTKKIPHSEHKDSEDHVGIWKAEQVLLKMVEDGNINYSDAINNITGLSYGVKIAIGNPLRQAKDSVITFTALCCRAAIRGGLSAALSYNINDYYLQSIEQCESITALTVISHNMYDDYIKRIHKLKLSPHISEPIRSCCDYIQMHIYDELDLTMLAQYVGYSNYYLSRRFKTEVGIPINDYIRNRKIEEAKLLLSTTHESILDISLKLHFSSRNYFSDVFQKTCGMSPKQYRLLGIGK